MTSEPQQRFSRADATAVTLSMIVVSAMGYVVMLITARTLTLEQNTSFLTFWSLLFFTFGILTGMQNEVTRSVRQRNESGSSRGEGARILPVALVAGGVVAVFHLSLIPFSARILGTDQGWAPLVFAAIGAMFFAGHGATVGGLSGAGRWRTFAVLSSSEATMRVILVCLSVAFASATVKLSTAEAASAFAAGTWILLFLFSRSLREAVSARSDRSAGKTASAVFRAMGGGIGNSVLLVGFPVLLSITTNHDEYAAAAPFLLAISLTRAPIMVPLTSFQGVIITQFVSNKMLWRQLLIRYSSVVMAFAAVGAVMAALVGPWLMQFFFGAGYRVSPAVLAWLMIAAGLIAVQTICSALLLAISRQGAYALGWLMSAAVCIAVLLGPWALQTRAILGLLVGTTCGIVLHLAMLNRATKSLI